MIKATTSWMAVTSHIDDGIWKSQLICTKMSRFRPEFIKNARKYFLASVFSWECIENPDKRQEPRRLLCEFSRLLNILQRKQFCTFMQVTRRRFYCHPRPLKHIQKSHCQTTGASEQLVLRCQNNRLLDQWCICRTTEWPG